jgi:hypothetical protein
MRKALAPHDFVQVRSDFNNVLGMGASYGVVNKAGQ